MFLFTSNQVKSLHLKKEFTHLPKCVGFESLTFKTFSNPSCITLHNFYPSFDVHLYILCICFLVHWYSDYLLGYYLLLYISRFSNTDKSSIDSIIFSYCTSSPGVIAFHCIRICKQCLRTNYSLSSMNWSILHKRNHSTPRRLRVFIYFNSYKHIPPTVTGSIYEPYINY